MNAKSQKRILVVVTSHAKLGNTGKPTGFWLEELAVPYRVFVDAGAHVDLASPLGGTPPADPKSESEPSAEVKAFVDDSAASAKLKNTIALERVAASNEKYDAVFLAGGHGTMWDLPNNAALKTVVERVWRDGGVVAAVCHGPAGLVGPVVDGKPIVHGKRVAGFSNEEEDAVGLTGVVPFPLESKLKELGGNYEQGPMWKPFVVADGRLVTGQNPSSSKGVAEQTLAALAR